RSDIVRTSDKLTMLSWMRQNAQPGPAIGSAVAPKRKQQSRDVLYPIFEECAALEPDPDLRRELENLAHNILPKGFNVRNKTLAYTDNTKTITIRMDLEPDTLRKEVLELLASKRGIVR